MLLSWQLLTQPLHLHTPRPVNPPCGCMLRDSPLATGAWCLIGSPSWQAVRKLNENEIVSSFAYILDVCDLQRDATQSGWLLQEFKLWNKKMFSYAFKLMLSNHELWFLSLLSFLLYVPLVELQYSFCKAKRLNLRSKYCTCWLEVYCHRSKRTYVFYYIYTGWCTFKNALNGHSSAGF